MPRYLIKAALEWAAADVRLRNKLGCEMFTFITGNDPSGVGG
jgi:hypothetical protein